MRTVGGGNGHPVPHIVSSCQLAYRLLILCTNAVHDCTVDCVAILGASAPASQLVPTSFSQPDPPRSGCELDGSGAFVEW